MRDRSPSHSGRVRSSSDSPTPEEVVIHDTSDFLPIEQRTMLTGDTRQSENFETGVDGWYQDGDGNAEFNNVLLRGELVIFDGTDELSLTSQGVVLPTSEDYYPPYGPFDEQLGDIRWHDEDDEVRGYIRTQATDTYNALYFVAAPGPDTTLVESTTQALGGAGILARASISAGASASDSPGSIAVQKDGDGEEAQVIVNGYPYPESMHTQGIIDSNTTNIAVTSFTAASTVVGSNAVNLRPGRRYRANCWVGYNVTNADTRVNATMDLSSGTSSIDVFPNSNVILTPGATTTRTFVGSWEFEPKSSTTTTLNASVRIRFGRRDGTGNLNTVSNVEAAFISVEDIGPASYNITN